MKVSAFAAAGKRIAAPAKVSASRRSINSKRVRCCCIFWIGAKAMHGATRMKTERTFMLVIWILVEIRLLVDAFGFLQFNGRGVGRKLCERLRLCEASLTLKALAGYQLCNELMIGAAKSTEFHGMATQLRVLIAVFRKAVEETCLRAPILICATYIVQMTAPKSSKSTDHHNVSVQPQLIREPTVLLPIASGRRQSLTGCNYFKLTS